MQKVPNDEDGTNPFLKQLEEPTPLDRSPYAVHVGRGAKVIAKNSEGFFDLMSHG